MALASEDDDAHEPCNRDDGTLRSVHIVFDLCQSILRQSHDEGEGPCQGSGKVFFASG